MKKKIAVGLSGGVDSAVTAYLLKKQGYNIYSIYLSCYDEDAPGCRAKQDRQDALKVALKLNIPFQVLDFKKEYKRAVIDYFKKEYLAGRTPNPDIICNRDIKFGLFLDWAEKQHFDYIATGHYAKLVRKSQLKSISGKVCSNQLKSAKIGLRKNSDKSESDSADLSTIRFGQPQAGQADPADYQPTFLTRPKDLHKDQTYFLWAVPRQKLQHVLFPLGKYTKAEVRQIAKEAKLPVADKPDSTGICFIGEVRVEDFLKRLGVKEKRGDAVIKVCQFQKTQNTRRPGDSENQRIGEPENSDPALRYSDGLTFRSSEFSEFSEHIHSDSCYRVIGTHRGVAFYTIGQRHGFSVDSWPPKSKAKGQRPKAKGAADPTSLSPKANRPPLYVIDKDIRRNRLVVGFGAETYRDSFEAADCNWLTSEKDSSFGAERTVLCRIRHLGDLIPCEIKTCDHSLKIENCKLKIKLSVAQRGLAPGQSAVFYGKTGIVLGGGVIQ